MILAVFLVLVIIFVVLPLIGWALWLLVSTIVVGLIVGALGRMVVPGRNRIGFWATVACGLVGSIVGGVIGRGIHHGRLVTVLVEIGISAAAVAVWSAVGRRSVGGGGPRQAIGRW